MLDLSPTKLLIIFIVAVVLLGPKRLPQLARQMGSGWRKLRELHERVDREVRQSMPDLPSSRDIARFARSPVTLLNQFAEMGPDTSGAGLDGRPASDGARPLGSQDGRPAAGASPSLDGPPAHLGPSGGASDGVEPGLAGGPGSWGADGADGWEAVGAWGNDAGAWGLDDPGMN